MMTSSVGRNIQTIDFFFVLLRYMFVTTTIVGGDVNVIRIVSNRTRKINFVNSGKCIRFMVVIRI